VGLILSAMQRPGDARNAFGRAIQARPEYAEAHYNLGFSLSALGDYDGALRATKRAMELEPYYVPQKFELVIDLEHEDPDLAIAPDLGGAHAVEGAVASFDFDAARLDDLFSELAPQDVGGEAAPEPAGAAATPYAAAGELLARGLADDALREITHALHQGADRATGYTLLGDVFAAQGVHGEALERFRQARSVNGTVPRAIAGEARALLALGRAAEAREVAESLLRVDPANVDWLLLVARARGQAGDAHAARDLLDGVRARFPARADVLKEFGDAARLCGDAEGAMQAYRAALELDGHFAVVRHDLALLLVAQGDFAGAEQELLAALESVPTYAGATLALASVRRRAGLPREAIGPLAELLQRDPWNLDALLLLGDVLLDVGRFDDASRAAERIIRFEPRHVDGLCLQAEVCSRQRRYADAIATWRRVLAIAPEGSQARRAERGIRTASDLLRVLRPSEEAA
jgi:tetratricopeptide (TPR) repeat protein